MRVASLTAVLAMMMTNAALAEPDWKAVGQALGKEGAVMPGGVYRVGLPRSDLKVTLDGVAIKPALALGSWLAFKPMGNEAMVMGDLVLTEDEVNPVMKKLLESGLEITALHNHLLRSEPATMYMHVAGHGEPVKLAAALREGLAGEQDADGRPAGGRSGRAGGARHLDTAALDAALGARARRTGRLPVLHPARRAGRRTTAWRCPRPWARPSPSTSSRPGGGKAAITGDFVLTADEVNPVLRALRSNGIEVTAVHNHMLDDEPRLFFMHFWANDDPQKLAKGLRAALDQVKVGKAP